MPLVQHVVEQARRCALLSEVVVAADDQAIADALAPYGTRVILTDPACPSGTDRVAEAARQLEADLVVNVQGDEPEIDPASLGTLVRTLAYSDAPMATLATKYPSQAEPADPNLVKLALSRTGHALYFSRLPIPFDRGSQGRPPEHPLLLHVGVYAYRHDFLATLASLSPTPLEQAEKLEQLRVLEHDYRIAVAVVEHTSHGIDTPAQYAAFVQRHLASRPL